MGFYLPSTTMTKRLNDQLRREGSPELGKVVCTREVSLLPQKQMNILIHAVRTFDDFNEDNDPYDEHDYGSIVINEDTFIWKIDYYDSKYEMGVDESIRNNTDACKRVLTIMYAHEY
jgi:hypothetical protein